MNELLPCPFCGSTTNAPIEEVVHLSHTECEEAPFDQWTVQCDNCTATMGYSETADEAIEAWNCRTTPPEGAAP